MKKVFRFMAIAAVSFGLCMNVACNKDDDTDTPGGGDPTPVVNPDNLPTTLDENFDAGIAAWTTIDKDGDSYTWMSLAELIPDAGRNGSASCAMSQSYINNVGALTPDNYLISEKLWIEDGKTLTWYVAAQDANYPEEHYAVELGNIVDGQFVTIATLFEETFSGTAKDQTGWYQRTVDMSQYKGQGACIAFRHYNCTDAFYLLIDDVKLQ